MDKAGTNHDAQLLIRLPQALKTALQREATINSRTLTSEVNMRLQKSFVVAPPSYTTPSAATVHTTLHEPGAQTKGPADPFTETDRAMLAVFRRLPVEKQLALLSLFN
jgi:hypothetical protein